MLDLSNRTFGILHVKRKTELREDSKVVWECYCECGTIKLVRSTNLTSGNTRSCGCQIIERTKERLVGNKFNYKHGLTYTKEYRNFKNTERRARKLKATPIWADMDAIKTTYINCPKGYHVDHIVPLKGKNVCGLHTVDNLQYLTAIDNIRKSNKHLTTI